MKYAFHRNPLRAVTVTVAQIAGDNRVLSSQTFRATVLDNNGNPAAGTVQFSSNVNGNFGGVVTLSGSGIGDAATTVLSGGAHTITATFVPNGPFIPNSGNAAISMYWTTQITVVLDNAPVQYGASQVLRATMTSTGGGTPTNATIDFYVAGSLVGSAATSGGVATFNIGATRSVGTYTTGGIYPATGYYVAAGSSTGGTSFTINKADVTVGTPVDSIDPTDYGQDWNLTTAFTSNTGAAITGTYRIFRANVSQGDTGITNLTSGNTDSVLISGTSDTDISTRIYTVQFLGGTNFNASGVSADCNHTQTKQDSTTGIVTSSPKSGHAPNDQVPTNSFQTFSGSVSYERGIIQTGSVDVWVTLSGGGSTLLGNLAVNGSGNYSGSLQAAVAAGTYTLECFFLGAAQTNSTPSNGSTQDTAWIVI